MTKILIIEDDDDVRENLRDILEINMYDVVEAVDGEEGVALALSDLPDLIISDVMMPRLDGFEVLEQLRANNATSTIPFIFLTARIATADLRHGMLLGATDFLKKPFSHDELLKVIDTRLQLKTQTESFYNRASKDLSNNLSRALPHELRTPLAPIVNYAQIMQTYADQLSVDDIKEFGASILRGAERLSHLIENYLTIAKLELFEHNPEELKNILKYTASSSGEVIDEAIHAYFTSNPDRVDDFEMQVDDVGLTISVHYLTKIVHELVDNACKFSEHGTPIRMRSRIVDNYLELIIRDQGLGMTPEQIRQIGTYMQFDRESHEQQGLGLGLAIVKKVVELYKGKLTIKSKPDSGTLVSVMFPLSVL